MEKIHTKNIKGMYPLSYSLLKKGFLEKKFLGTKDMFKFFDGQDMKVGIDYSTVKGEFYSVINSTKGIYYLPYTKNLKISTNRILVGLDDVDVTKREDVMFKTFETCFSFLEAHLSNISTNK